MVDKANKMTAKDSTAGNQEMLCSKLLDVKPIASSDPAWALPRTVTASN